MRPLFGYLYSQKMAKPVSVRVDTFGTGTVSDTQLEDAVEKTFDLRPAAIIRDLNLRRPIYRQLAESPWGPPMTKRPVGLT